jgi:hypothetical protein
MGRALLPDYVRILTGLEDKTNGRGASCYDPTSYATNGSTYLEIRWAEGPIRRKERRSAALLVMERSTRALRIVNGAMDYIAPQGTTYYIRSVHYTH